MEWKLQVVVVPVTDVDRAKAFYVDQLGFHLDADTNPTETMRVVQMTPPGSTSVTGTTTTCSFHSMALTSPRRDGVASLVQPPPSVSWTVVPPGRTGWRSGARLRSAPRRLPPTRRCPG